MVALPGSGSRLARLVRRAWVPTLVVLVTAYGALLHYLALGLPGVGYLSETQLIPVGWRELATQLDDLEEQLAHETGEEPVVIGMDKYFTASQLTFYDDDPADRTSENTGPHLFGAKALMYEVWFPPATFEGRPAILVSFDEHSLRNKKIPRHLDHLGPNRRGVIRRDGKFVREYFYRVGHEYRSKRRG